MAIKLTQHFAFPAATLWAIIGQPDRVDWVPGSEGCSFDGRVRCFTLPGAGALKEQILSLNEDKMRIEYSCIESPIPLARHLASMQVLATDEGCELVWETVIQPEKFEPFIVQSMRASLTRLDELLAAGSG